MIQYQQQVRQELKHILDWWITNMPDQEQGGFHGSMDANGNIDTRAPRGLVMYSRILWTFAAAYKKDTDARYLEMAERAFGYLQQYFMDEEQGGMYWSVDRNGKPLEDKKQVYGLAFAIYGLSEFHSATGNGNALLMAIDLYQLIEQHNENNTGGGYLEAFTRHWKPIADLRLSEKDANEKKSMNTHLHVLEAYTNLYGEWKNEKLAGAIRELLVIFETYIIDTKTYTQQLFFNEAWEPQSSIVSYGHDIEASWLLYEAANVLEDEALKIKWEAISIIMANTARKGLDDDGGMWYEKEGDRLIKEKHWWPQAEAMVGYMNAFELSKDTIFLELSANSFSFIQNNLLDTKNGEWFWGIAEDGSMMQKEKAGFWKCPYHNGRACLEMDRRLQTLLQQATQPI
ncbi:MAG: N-acyl-D-glucosamine 2-epimerase [Chitinophagaceae bacterium]|nr:MAG: N-acyl-D-glucosamine 2-epimerase [Chitinophagaceae bacterium]